ncbi:MAG: hypothetical protein HC812_04785 [Leptolyngbya sp. RL_3_1]|nr:hypothetical protein [Leptolyngbya sp. RL_3_1]
MALPSLETGPDPPSHLQTAAVPPSKTALSASELKLLQHLQGCPQGRADIAQLNLALKALPLTRLCQSLRAQGWAETETTIQRFRASRTGRTLMALDTTALPLTPDQYWVLRSCRDHSITPAQIHRRVPANLRPDLIQSLADQGLVKITKSQLIAVWLTPAGQRLLQA